MKKVIIAPDSFKETMTNIEVANIIYTSLKEKYPNYEYKLFPIADGGEGSLNAFYETGGILKTCISKGANNEDISANYLIYNDTIVIEVAQNVGFKYKMEYSNPGNTTTYGIGEVLKDALKTNNKKVYFCLGGTITNDGGCGLASSLGIKFFDDKDNEFNELYYTYQFGGKWNWLTLGVGQFPIYNFDGTDYDANQQVNFLNEA